MEFPSIKKILDIRDRSETLGPPKIPEIKKESLGPKQVYISWESKIFSSEKSFIGKKFSRPVILIGALVGLLFLVMQEFVLIIMVGSIIFFLQAYSKMGPENVKYEISNHGIMVGDSLYYWDKLRRYFFLVREDTEMIGIDTVLGFPGRLFINFEKQDREKIKEFLDKYLHYIESEPRTFLDNTYDRIASKFSTDEEGLVLDGSTLQEEEKDLIEPDLKEKK
jgi:hypothetical protein